MQSLKVTHAPKSGYVITATICLEYRMCRGKSGTEYCSELGPDPALWSRRTPLPKPPAFDQCLDGFVDACIADRDGDLDSSLKPVEALSEKLTIGTLH